MIHDLQRYVTNGKIQVLRSTTHLPVDTALEGVLERLDYQRGGLLASSYEYPGRYKRWAVGFVNPPLEIATKANEFVIKAHNERGQMLIPCVADCLCQDASFEELTRSRDRIAGSIRPSRQLFKEEERSRQPSVFTVIRSLLKLFYSDRDEHLGLYGALGYDLVFQFEPIPQSRGRAPDQRDLVMYLPDELILVDYHRQQASRLCYEFETHYGSTSGLPRSGERIDYRGSYQAPSQASDHAPGEYAQLVEHAFDYFRRGDLFEVVPSQNFYQTYGASPVKLFRTLQQINPSPYGFIFNLGGEYIIGSSPEMFVRVDGRRVETCPISGTIRRGRDAIEDAQQIQQLLNSRKDESELTMCTDVDRNDKSRICEPSSVQVIGRRQVELYSHLIHTVDHVEGILRPEFDALDAFLTHTWAVTVTGAPKRAAIQFVEQHERSPRRWYGGAVGYLAFDGNLNTGLVLRTIRLKDSVAEVRVGATVLYDSSPAAEAQETITKAAAMMQALRQAQQVEAAPVDQALRQQLDKIAGFQPKVLLIDHEDSFVHTLANYIRQTGAVVTTLRHGFPDSVLTTEAPDLVVLSPGPGSPADFRLAATIAACQQRQIPIFGVCLGLQGIVEALGGQLGVLDYPHHGKPSQMRVVDASSMLFEGMPQAFEGGRYHSLYALPESLPSDLRVTAIAEDGVIMAVEHKTLPIAAVQFHPESIMTIAGNVGLAIIQNVVRAYTSPNQAPSSLLPLHEATPIATVPMPVSAHEG